MLYREIMLIDPFTGMKKSTAVKGKKWEDVAENLNQLQSWQNGSSITWNKIFWYLKIPKYMVSF